MIKNDQGQIAVKWVLNRPAKTIKMAGSNQYYVFTSKFNIQMAWVNQSDLNGLLVYKEKTCPCNNGTYKNAFTLANLMDVNIWMTGDRHGNGMERTWTEV